MDYWGGFVSWMQKKSIQSKNCLLLNLWASLQNAVAFVGFPFQQQWKLSDKKLRQHDITSWTVADPNTHLCFPVFSSRLRFPRRFSFPALSVMETRDISLSDDSDDQFWPSPFNSTPGESCCEIRFSGEIDGPADPRRDSSASECLLEIDLESGDLEMKEHLSKLQRDCRICQLELAGNGEVESSTTMELGCSCKGDLGAAHKHCAQTWFKIRGNTICEICGTTALNIANDQINEVNNANAAITSSDSAAPAVVAENQTCRHGGRLMNFMFTCMLIGFVVSWLFHFKLIS